MVIAQRSRRLTFEPPTSFDDWRARLRQVGSVPVIAVAGSRGKSTVIRLLDAIFNSAGLSTATWTNSGVEIRGRRQRGELVPWSRALGRLSEGRLDVAIHELDWSTLRAVGLPEGLYPVVAVTNVCVNSDECLIHAEARRAMLALPSVLRAVHPRGVTVLNGEDYAVSGEEAPPHSAAILVAQSRETPLLRAHLGDGGMASWVGEQGIAIGAGDHAIDVCHPRLLPVALAGDAAFQVLNVMVAASAAYAVGINAETIQRALAGYTPDPLTLHGSFNVIPAGGSTIIIDRPDPSWFLRPILRVVRDIPRQRLITVAGRFANAPGWDLQEVGRLIGRVSSAVVLHSQDDDAERAELLRRGIAMSDVPPIVIHTTTERRAVNRALRSARAGDAVFILAEQAPAVVRAVLRATNDPTIGSDEDGGFD